MSTPGDSQLIDGSRSAGEVEHGFTHFTLTLQILRGEGDAADVVDGGHYTLPSAKPFAM